MLWQARFTAESNAEIMHVPAGKHEAVSYDCLEECTNWSRFASAVYAVVPVEEK